MNTQSEALRPPLVSSESESNNRSVILIGLAIAIAAVTLTAVNVALGLTLAGLTDYARNAWIIAAINGAVLLLAVSVLQPSIVSVQAHKPLLTAHRLKTAD